MAAYHRKVRSYYHLELSAMHTEPPHAYGGNHTTKDVDCQVVNRPSGSLSRRAEGDREHEKTKAAGTGGSSAGVFELSAGFKIPLSDYAGRYGLSGRDRSRVHGRARAGKAHAQP